MKDIDSIKHRTDTRAHIPSKEEAGYEDASDKVSKGNKVLELPKNPVTHRGQDPELYWLNKYGNDDRDELLKVDIRSLYRHEHIAPETLIKNLYKVTEQKPEPNPQLGIFDNVNELFGNALEKDELEKVSEYYHHQDGWTNRLIQGDSQLVMASLLEREGMAGQVQTIFFDPPYGIKYGGNWQIKLNDREVKDGNDEALTGEPEQIKAFRDTWELGIHSYLSYLRDRLLIARELLSESGSCFLQIGDENVHLVRSVMDEVFGSENFVSLISFAKTTGLNSNFLYGICDYIIWYGKDINKLKYRQQYSDKIIGGAGASKYNRVELPNGERRPLTKEEKEESIELPKGTKFWVDDNLTSQGNPLLKFNYQGKEYSGTYKTNLAGLENLAKRNRIYAASGTLRFVRYYNDFPVYPTNSAWMDIGGIQSRVDGKVYVVQTANEAIKRCILMTTDPGDLVLDPTCGSATTAYVAEQWGRRWITIDTSRIALNIAKQRLMTAVFPYYHLYSDVEVQKLEKDGKIKKSVTEKPENQKTGDIRQGFVYEEVPHITLKSLANDEPPETETLYDKPQTDKNRLRVSGPFTVETLQNFEPISPEELDVEVRVNEEEGAFEEVIKQHLLSTGIKNGRKEEMVLFRSVELLAGEYLHAEGFYQTEKGEAKAYFHIGPKFGTVSKKLVNEAVRECRQKGDSDWLVILGFSFESDIEGSTQTTSMGNFEVTKCRIHDDLLQDGLKKKPAKSAASFVTIGEPDIAFLSQKELDFKMESAKRGIIIEDDLSYRNDKIPVGEKGYVKILGLDIYDPIKDVVNARNVHDIAYWMVDDDYDGSNFILKQVFFCGGDKDEFTKWRKGLDNLAKDNTKKKVEKLFKIEIDDEAFDRLYGHISHPIEVKKKGQKIAVRIVSQFGEESTKVLSI